MPNQNENLYIANLDFLLNYGNGETNDEIESEIYKLAFQIKGTAHYDRALGGSFQDIEQEQSSAAEVIMLMFGANLVESIYTVNVERNFSPYILVGFNDITSELEDTTLNVNVQYRLLKDLKVQGLIKLEL